MTEPSMQAKRRVAAIEAGGTKFIVGVGTHWASGELATIPTTAPEETMAAVMSTLRGAWDEQAFEGIGVASFGPLNIDPKQPDYGAIGTTPKPGWEGYNFVTELGAAFGVPVIVETDVNAAALAEYHHGAGTDCRRVIYVTVGTGIGGGIVHDGKISNGFTHPEIGHIPLPKHPDDLVFAGICPFHGDCLEGLASGPAIKARWGKTLSQLEQGHPAHALEAWYLGQMCRSLILHHAPDCIVIGGGVAKAPQLVDSAAARCHELMAGYLPTIDCEDAMRDMIVSPGLSAHSGIAGAWLLGNLAASGGLA